jgi:hypothetical protein
VYKFTRKLGFAGVWCARILCISGAAASLPLVVVTDAPAYWFSACLLWCDRRLETLRG